MTYRSNRQERQSHFRSLRKVNKEQFNKAIHDQKWDERKMFKPIFGKEKGSFQMDFLVQTRDFDPHYWLIFININSRKAYAIPSKNNTSKDVIKALELINSKENITNLTTDREPSFLSNETVEWLIDHKIDLQTTEENDHNKLGIINRFMRTLRDMNDEHRNISRDDMKEYLTEYNNSTHSSTYQKPNKFKNEDQYIQDKQLETDEIEAKFPISRKVRTNIITSNFEKRRRNASKYHYNVIGRTGNEFIVQAKDKSVETFPRYMLSNKIENTKLANTIKNDKKSLIKRVVGKNGSK
jgi:hypothetical protein